ncbi:MAG: hypothetical protein KGL64_01860 [Acidobacteriota bacterium]|nr:hypothetical protein [Acidobacteriota bacterium]
MLKILHQKGLLSARSVGGWALLIIASAWKFIGSLSTASWVWGLLRSASPSVIASRPTGGGNMLAGSASSISTVLFLAGLAWLTAIVFVPIFRPNIYAKIVRATFVARHPFDELTRSTMQVLHLPFGVTEHDLLMRVFVVNKSTSPITIQRIEAEAELDGVWVKLRPSDLSHYADKKVEDRKLANTGLRNLAIKKMPLDDLWNKLKEQPLSRGVHKEGWLAFELQVDPEHIEKNKVNFRLTIIDSLDGRHPILDVGEIDRDRQITYSAEALG